MEKHDSTPEKLKKRRFFFPLKIMRVLFVVNLLSLLAFSRVNAQTSYMRWDLTSSNYLGLSWDLDDGVYIMDIRYFDYTDNVPTAGFIDWNEDWLKNDIYDKEAEPWDGVGYMKVKLPDGVEFKVNVDVPTAEDLLLEKYNNYSDNDYITKTFWKAKMPSVSDGTKVKLVSSDHYQKYYNCRVFWLPSIDYINLTTDNLIDVSGSKLYYNLSPYFHTLSGTIKLPKAEVNIREIKIDNVEYTTNDGKPAVKISWSKVGTEPTTGNADKLGDIKLLNSSGTALYSVSATNTSGDFFLYPTEGEINLNQTNTYTVKQEFTPFSNSFIKYERSSSTITVPAFPQVTDDSFKAAFDPNTMKLNVNWEIASGNVVEFDSRPFIVTRYIIKDSTATVNNTVTILKDTVDIVNDTCLR